MTFHTEQTRRYLANCTPEQLRAMLSVIYSRSRDLAPEPLSLHKVLNPQKSMVTKRTKNKGLSKTDPDAAKRPLNSWMGFRCFYAPIFQSHQQKVISGYLRKLWKADPFHAKWTILTKAYSVIRDHIGKSLAPLDAFVKLTCPYIGITSPNDYLKHLGWDIVNDETGQKSLVRSDVPAFDESQTTTSLSVQDIITHCYNNSYTTRDDIKVPNEIDSLNFVARPSNQISTFGFAVAIPNAVITVARSPSTPTLTSGTFSITATPQFMGSGTTTWTIPPMSTQTVAQAVQNPITQCLVEANNTTAVPPNIMLPTFAAPVNSATTTGIATDNNIVSTSSYGHGSNGLNTFVWDDEDDEEGGRRGMSAYMEEVFSIRDYSGELVPDVESGMTFNPTEDNGFDAYSYFSPNNTNLYVPVASMPTATASIPWVPTAPSTVTPYNWSAPAHRDEADELNMFDWEAFLNYNA